MVFKLPTANVLLLRFLLDDTPSRGSCEPQTSPLPKDDRLRDGKLWGVASLPLRRPKPYWRVTTVPCLGRLALGSEECRPVYRIIGMETLFRTGSWLGRGDGAKVFSGSEV